MTAQAARVRPMRAPPGVTQADFAQALTQFEAAIGKQWVFTNDDDVVLYRDAYSPFWGEPEERVASAALAPESVEQVQAVVRIANGYRVPLYTISTGRNLGYGGSAPNFSGCVVLDLKRMSPKSHSTSEARSSQLLTSRYSAICTRMRRAPIAPA